jgi:phosphate transport system substrate-binding protein
MKLGTSLKSILVLILLIGASFAAGCVNDSVTARNEIMVTGSTSVKPIADELAEVYMQKNPGVVITVGGGGSTVGITNVREGTTDIGMSSRDLKGDEKTLNKIVIAWDGVAVVVNPTNNVDDLTLEQIKKIYTGEIVNWNEVGGVKAKITVVTREEGSGTRGTFEDIIMGEDKTTIDAITQPSTGAVKATVAGDKNAIGYISLAALTEDVKSLKIGGVEPTADKINAGEYPLVRPFLFVTKQEPSGLAKDFIDFSLGDDGQKIIERNGCVSIR